MSLHGGDVWSLAGSHGLGPRGLVDFSASLNPHGLPSSVARLLGGEPDLACLYPDPRYAELRRGLAVWLGLDPACVAVGNGASELIRELLITLRPASVLVLEPGFAEYRRAAGLLGIPVSSLGLEADANFALDPRALERRIAAERPGLVFLCNPHNPTSRLLGREAMERLLGAAEQAGSWLVVDECFIELSPAGPAASLAPLVGPGHPGLIVLRALTKLFALAGLRLGYLAAAPAVAETVRAGQLPWPVNGFAAGLGGIFEAEAAYLAKTAAWLAGEPAWLAAGLRALPGIAAVVEPEANFVLCRLAGGRPAATLRAELIGRGLLIRDCQGFPGLGPDWFRVAVRLRGENQGLLDALAAAR